MILILSRSIEGDSDAGSGYQRIISFPLEQQCTPPRVSRRCRLYEVYSSPLQLEPSVISKGAVYKLSLLAEIAAHHYAILQIQSITTLAFTKQLLHQSTRSLALNPSRPPINSIPNSRHEEPIPPPRGLQVRKKKSRNGLRSPATHPP